MNQDQERKLELLLAKGVKKGELMSIHTSWRVGGPADYFVTPVDCSEVAAVIRFCIDSNLPLFVFGNGTNLLVREGGIRGVVMKIGTPFQYMYWEKEGVCAGAGASLPYLARTAARRGLEGLEFAGGIPGTLGGALIMNAGAFGSYIGSLVQEVTVVDWGGNKRVLEPSECHFAYRSSTLAGTGVVVEARLNLRPGDPEELQRRLEGFMEERFRRHPQQPSAGSVFRNPRRCPAGRLIEEAGGKGLRIGGAQVSEQHANFIVNLGGATASDILSLIDTVYHLVRGKYGIELQPEVRVIGEES